VDFELINLLREHKTTYFGDPNRWCKNNGFLLPSMRYLNVNHRYSNDKHHPGVY